MAHVFKCQCEEVFSGAEAVKHASRCQERAKLSRLHTLCTELRSEDPHALVVELIAEIAISCNDHLTNELVAKLLTENEERHGRAINTQDDVVDPSPLLPPVQPKEEKLCAICGSARSEAITLACGHITCEVHYGLLMSENRCAFAACAHTLKEEEKEAIKQNLGLASPLPAEDRTPCTLCSQPQPMDMLMFLDCMHIVCRAHIAKVFEEQYLVSSSVQCPMPDCQYFLTSPEIEAVVGADKLAEADTATALKLVRELSSVVLVTCSKCGMSGGLEKGRIDFTFKDARGQKICEEAAVYMSKHRFRCPNCHTTMCATCGVTPYHDAFTCESYKAEANRPICRFCKKSLDSENCQEADCVERSGKCCEKVLPCGHNCFGSKGEAVCLPCLKCLGLEHDICVICHCEELSAAACVKLQCGHFLHLHCLESVFERRWPGPRITFKFATCPACNAWVQTECLPELSARLQTYIDLHAQVQEKAVKRLEFEKEDQLPRFTDPSDPYFSKPAKYAMDRLCYYECFKCKHPYFGGKRDCQLVEEERVYNPEELVCAKCASYQGGEGNCLKHGEDYVQFKCRYCCELAVWFCWGTTHFCEPCHNIWEQRRDSPRDQLPQCPGMPACPLQVVHPANGEEFGLGCIACREELDKQHQDF